MLKIYGVGTLVADPKLKKLENSGTHVCNFRLAFNEYRGTGEQRQSEAHYFDFVLWDSGAEAFGKLLKKGDRVFVEGILKEKHYTDEKGEERHGVVIRVSTFTPIPKQAKPETEPTTV